MMRWWVITLIFLATFINFIDRLTISVLAPVITTELGLTNLQFAGISTWFLIAYTASQGASGRLYDRIGPRRGFSLSVTVWSFAAMAHAFARGLASLSFVRFVLGVGEAGNWPGAAKVIAEWFPVRERAFAMAIFNSGVAVGSIVAPPLIVWLQVHYGWQMTFLVTGSLGFGWLALWLATYKSSNEQPASAQQKIRWLELLRYRQVWAIVVARFLTDPVWWLYITWLPLYLFNVRGFSLQQIGMFAWLPYVAADAGSLSGGWMSGHLIARGWSEDKARKTVIVAGALLMSGGIFAAFTASAVAALGFIAVVLFGFQSWINNVQTMPSDFFPENAVASVAGLGGVGAGIGAMLFTLTTGFVVDHFHSYTPILVVAGLLPMLGTAVLFRLGGRIHRLSFEANYAELFGSLR
jgi:MFS transporter, ACS family, hexuronate transporter